MHCETLLRLSIEEVNFTSVRKTNIALSVLKAKLLQWTTTVCENCKKKGKLGGYGWPPGRMGKILVGGLAQWTGGSNLPNPPSSGNSHPACVNWLLEFEPIAVLILNQRQSIVDRIVAGLFS